MISEILKTVNEASEFYYRLVLLVGPSGSGKTTLLKELSTLKSVPIVNVNLELSKRMLELTHRDRSLRVQHLLSIIIDVIDELVLLDNVELLFDINLKQDPLRLLKQLSRNKTVVVSWNGLLIDGFLTYAVPGHPEYRKYPVQDLLMINLQTQSYKDNYTLASREHK